MATLRLNDCRASPFGHSTLRVRRNHLVLGRDEVPTRLALPRRFTDLSTERRHAPRDLRVCHEGSLVWFHISGERSSELRPIEKQEAALRRQYRRHRCAWGRVLNELCHGFPLVRSESGNV